MQDRHVRLAIVIGIVAVAVRLIAINQPFVDQWSWRQSDVAAIARNFSENGFHFAHPQIDWAGSEAGYVGTEFPILPFIAAACYKLVGVHEWVGRVQAVILFALSLPFFLLLVREIFGATAAVWAILFYGFAPLSVMASRCFMPDMPSLSLSIIGLYFFQRWIANERSTCVLAAAACVSLSILIKAPAAIIGVPLAALAFERFRFSALRRIELWIFAIIALAPSALWYWHAHDIAEKFYPHHFFGAGGFQIMGAAWYWKIAQQLFSSSLSPIGACLALIGALFSLGRSRATIFHVWLVSMLAFVVVVGYGNRHQWYQLPFAPIAAAFSGFALDLGLPRVSRFRRIGAIVIVGLVSLTGLAYLPEFYKPTAVDLYAAGLELKRTTARNALIIAADYGDPTAFYYAERKGWHFLEKDGIYNGHPTSSADAIDDLEQLRKRGATHIVFYSGTLWWLDYYKEFADHLASTATLLQATPQFKIYKLNERAN